MKDLMIRSIIEAYLTDAVTSMASRRTIKCERQVFHGTGAYDEATVNEVTEAIQGTFNIGLRTLIAPAAVFGLVILRMPALPALLMGALLGAAEAVIFQPQLFSETEDGGFSWTTVYAAISTTAHSGLSVETGNEVTDLLFNRGGMLSMLNTVLLIIMAMLFGGAMEATGMLRTIAESILKLVRGAGSLIGATIGTCIVFNLTASDQSLAIVVPGRMFRNAYEDYNLDPKNLSRALEDGGTVTSVLVPWNTGGAFASTILTVPTAAYAPYCLFNLLSPLVGVAFAAMNLTIARTVANADSCRQE
jgi:NhaC family Na+:H+ antiporter